MSKFYCPRIKNGVAFTPNRTYDVCGIRDLNSSNNMGIGSTSYDEFNNSQYKQELLSFNNSDSWPTGCESCKWTESLGLQSARQYEILLEQNNGEQPLTHLNSGNICDSDCVMCGPRWSTTIANRLKIYPDPNKEYFALGKDGSELPFNKNSLENIKDSIKNSKRLKVVGGEPFLDKKLWKFLNEIAREDLKLYVVTNGNSYPTPFQKSVLDKFKSIEITFSIDGTGITYEWIRQNLKYKTVVENYLKFKSWTETTVIAVVQAHNILDLSNLKKTFKNSISFVPLVHPSLLSIQNAPRWTIDKALNDNTDSELRKILTLCESTNESNLDALIKHTEYLNGHRTYYFDVKTWSVQKRA